MTTEGQKEFSKMFIEKYGQCEDVSQLFDELFVFALKHRDLLSGSEEFENLFLNLDIEIDASPRKLVLLAHAFEQKEEMPEEMSELLLWSPVKALKFIESEYAIHHYPVSTFELYLKDEEAIKLIIEAGKQTSPIEPCFASLFYYSQAPQHKLVKSHVGEVPAKLSEISVADWIDLLSQYFTQQSLEGSSNEFIKAVSALNKLSKCWDLVKASNLPIVKSNSNMKFEDLAEIYAGNYDLVPDAKVTGGNVDVESLLIDDISDETPERQAQIKAFLATNYGKLLDGIKQNVQIVYNQLQHSNKLDFTKNLKFVSGQFSRYSQNKMSESEITSDYDAVMKAFNNYKVDSVGTAMDAIVHGYIPALNKFKNSRNYSQQLASSMLYNDQLSFLGVACKLEPQGMIGGAKRKSKKGKTVTKVVHEKVYVSDNGKSKPKAKKRPTTKKKGGLTIDIDTYSEQPIYRSGETSTGRFLTTIKNAQIKFNTSYVESYRSMLNKLENITQEDITALANDTAANFINQFDKILISSPKTTYKISGLNPEHDLSKMYIIALNSLINLIKSVGAKPFMPLLSDLTSIKNMCETSRALFKSEKQKLIQNGKTYSELLLQNDVTSVIQIPCALKKEDIIRMRDSCRKISLFAQNRVGTRTSSYSTEALLTEYLHKSKDRNTLINNYFATFEQGTKYLLSSLTTQEENEMFKPLILMKLQLIGETKKAYIWLNQFMETFLVQKRLDQFGKKVLTEEQLNRICSAYTGLMTYTRQNAAKILERYNQVLRSQEKGFLSYFKIFRLARETFEEVNSLGFIEKLYKTLGIDSKNTNWALFKSEILSFLANNLIWFDIYKHAGPTDDFTLIDLDDNGSEVADNNIIKNKLNEDITGETSIRQVFNALVSNTSPYKQLLNKKFLKTKLNITDADLQNNDANVPAAAGDADAKTADIIAKYNDYMRILTQITGLNGRNTTFTGNHAPLGEALCCLMAYGKNAFATYYSIGFSLRRRGTSASLFTNFDRYLIQAMYTPVIQVIDKYIGQRFTGATNMNMHVADMMLGGGKKIKAGSLFDVIPSHEPSNYSVISQATQFYVSAFIILKFYIDNYAVQDADHPNESVQQNVRFNVSKLSTIANLASSINSTTPATKLLFLTDTRLFKLFIGDMNDIWSATSGQSVKEHTLKAVDSFVSELNSMLVFGNDDVLLKIQESIGGDVMNNLDSTDFDEIKNQLEKALKANADKIISNGLNNNRIVDKMFEKFTMKIQNTPSQARVATLKQIISKVTSNDAGLATSDFSTFVDICVAPLHIIKKYYVELMDRINLSINNGSALLNDASTKDIIIKILLTKINNGRMYTSLLNYADEKPKNLKELYLVITEHFYQDSDQAIHNILNYPGMSDEQTTSICSGIHDAFKDSIDVITKRINDNPDLAKIPIDLTTIVIPQIPVDSIPFYADSSIRIKAVNEKGLNKIASFTRFVSYALAKQSSGLFLPQSYADLLKSSTELNGKLFDISSTVGSKVEMAFTTTGIQGIESDNRNMVIVKSTDPITSSLIYRSQSQVAVNTTSSVSATPLYATKIVSIIPFLLKILANSLMLFSAENEIYQFGEVKVNARTEIMTLQQILTQVYNEFAPYAQKVQFLSAGTLKFKHYISEVRSLIEHGDLTFDTLIESPESFEWAAYYGINDIGLKYLEFDRFSEYKQTIGNVLTDVTFKDQFDSILEVLSKVVVQELINQAIFNVNPNINNSNLAMQGGSYDFSELKEDYLNKNTGRYSDNYNITSVNIDNVLNKIHGINIDFNNTGNVPYDYGFNAQSKAYTQVVMPEQYGSFVELDRLTKLNDFKFEEVIKHSLSMFYGISYINYSSSHNIDENFDRGNTIKNIQSIMVRNEQVASLDKTISTVAPFAKFIYDLMVDDDLFDPDWAHDGDKLGKGYLPVKKENGEVSWILPKNTISIVGGDGQTYKIAKGVRAFIKAKGISLKWIKEMIERSGYKFTTKDVTYILPTDFYIKANCRYLRNHTKIEDILDANKNYQEKTWSAFGGLYSCTKVESNTTAHIYNSNIDPNGRIFAENGDFSQDLLVWLYGPGIKPLGTDAAAAADNRNWGTDGAEAACYDNSDNYDRAEAMAGGQQKEHLKQCIRDIIYCTQLYMLYSFNSYRYNYINDITNIGSGAKYCQYNQIPESNYSYFISNIKAIIKNNNALWDVLKPCGMLPIVKEGEYAACGMPNSIRSLITCAYTYGLKSNNGEFDIKGNINSNANFIDDVSEVQAGGARRFKADADINRLSLITVQGVLCDSPSIADIQDNIRGTHSTYNVGAVRCPKYVADDDAEVAYEAEAATVNKDCNSLPYYDEHDIGLIRNHTEPDAHDYIVQILPKQQNCNVIFEVYYNYKLGGANVNDANCKLKHSYLPYMRSQYKLSYENDIKDYPSVIKHALSIDNYIPSDGYFLKNLLNSSRNISSFTKYAAGKKNFVYYEGDTATDGQHQRCGLSVNNSVHVMCDTKINCRNYYDLYKRFASDDIEKEYNRYRNMYDLKINNNQVISKTINKDNVISINQFDDYINTLGQYNIYNTGFNNGNSSNVNIEYYIQNSKDNNSNGFIYQGSLLSKLNYKTYSSPISDINTEGSLKDFITKALQHMKNKSNEAILTDIEIFKHLLIPIISVKPQLQDIINYIDDMFNGDKFKDATSHVKGIYLLHDWFKQQSLQFDANSELEVPKTIKSLTLLRNFLKDALDSADALLVTVLTSYSALIDKLNIGRDMTIKTINALAELANSTFKLGNSIDNRFTNSMIEAIYNIQTHTDDMISISSDKLINNLITIADSIFDRGVRVKQMSNSYVETLINYGAKSALLFDNLTYGDVDTVLSGWIADLIGPHSGINKIYEETKSDEQSACKNNLFHVFDAFEGKDQLNKSISIFNAFYSWDLALRILTLKPYKEISGVDNYLDFIKFPSLIGSKTDCVKNHLLMQYAQRAELIVDNIFAAVSRLTHEQVNAIFQNVQLRARINNYIDNKTEENKAAIYKEIIADFAANANNNAILNGGEIDGLAQITELFTAARNIYRANALDGDNLTSIGSDDNRPNNNAIDLIIPTTGYLPSPLLTHDFKDKFADYITNVAWEARAGAVPREPDIKEPVAKPIKLNAGCEYDLDKFTEGMNNNKTVKDGKMTYGNYLFYRFAQSYIKHGLEQLYATKQCTQNGNEKLANANAAIGANTAADIGKQNIFLTIGSVLDSGAAFTNHAEDGGPEDEHSAGLTEEVFNMRNECLLKILDSYTQDPTDSNNLDFIRILAQYNNLNVLMPARDYPRSMEEDGKRDLLERNNRVNTIGDEPMTIVDVFRGYGNESVLDILDILYEMEDIKPIIDSHKYYILLLAEAIIRNTYGFFNRAFALDIQVIVHDIAYDNGSLKSFPKIYTTFMSYGGNDDHHYCPLRPKLWSTIADVFNDTSDGNRTKRDALMRLNLPLIFWPIIAYYKLENGRFAENATATGDNKIYIPAYSASADIPLIVDRSYSFKDLRTYLSSCYPLPNWYGNFIDGQNRFERRQKFDVEDLPENITYLPADQNQLHRAINASGKSFTFRTKRDIAANSGSFMVNNYDNAYNVIKIPSVNLMLKYSKQPEQSKIIEKYRLTNYTFTADSITPHVYSTDSNINVDSDEVLYTHSKNLDAIDKIEANKDEIDGVFTKNEFGTYLENKINSLTMSKIDQGTGFMGNIGLAAVTGGVLSGGIMLVNKGGQDVLKHYVDTETVFTSIFDSNKDRGIEQMILSYYQKPLLSFNTFFNKNIFVQLIYNAALFKSGLSTIAKHLNTEQANKFYSVMKALISPLIVGDSYIDAGGNPHIVGEYAEGDRPAVGNDGRKILTYDDISKYSASADYNNSSTTLYGTQYAPLSIRKFLETRINNTDQTISDFIKAKQGSQILDKLYMVDACNVSMFALCKLIKSFTFKNTTTKEDEPYEDFENIEPFGADNEIHI